VNLTRREFLQALSIGVGMYFSRMPFGNAAKNKSITELLKGDGIPKNYYDIPTFGNVSFLHFTDSHAQLLPAYYREPNVNIGPGKFANKFPFLSGNDFLNHFSIPKNTPLAYASSSVNYENLINKFGAMGGFSHMATLVKELKSSRPGALLLDGGDTWQGSATSLWTKGQDMVDACLALGVDVMTAHWEFTYGMERVKHVVENDFDGKIDFLAQNVLDLEFEDPVFQPYTLKEINGVQAAVIGQAFPFTPIAHPRHQVEAWQFGIREENLQEMIDEARAAGAKVVVLLSHNGLTVDMKLASRVTGLDAIMGGHTHDALPIAQPIKNSAGTTLVVNSGSMGKFLAVLDFDVRGGKIRDYQFNMVPVFSNIIPADLGMDKIITKTRKPYHNKLNEKLAINRDFLYRRGTFNGTFDQLICDALMETQNAEIAFSPGFRWGMSVLPGDPITYEDVMGQTAITYPQVTRNEFTGEFIKEIIESVGDNRFNPDPYFQQGGDMVRVGGLKYSLDLAKPQGKRINDMTLNGKIIDPKKKYVVAGWASVARDVKGEPVYDVVANYLRDKKEVKISNVNEPQIKNS